MRKHFAALSAFCSVLMVGCQQSEDGLEVKEEYPISIEASIGGVGASRYTGNEPNSAAFGNGDLIGLAYKVGTDRTNFVKWELEGGKWKPIGTSMTWKNLGEDHTFYAFYPYVDGATLDLVPMPNLANQNGTMLSVATSDFLITEKTQKYTTGGGKVSFTGVDDAFKHVSSLVVLTLKNAGDLVSATIKSVSLKGTNIASAMNYTFGATTPVSLDNTTSSINEISVALAEQGPMTADKKIYLVVNSGTVDLSAVTLEINYTAANEDVCKASLTGLNQNENDWFVSGCLYNYGITVTDRRVLVVSGGEICDWANGITMDEIEINGEKQ